MKHSYAKLAALLLALMLVLTGCNLVDVDQVALIEEERAETAKDLSTVLAEYDGGTITKFDVMAAFYGNYSYMAQLYSSMGMQMDADMLRDILENVVDLQMESVAIAKEFESRGLTLSKTDEEIAAEADEAYQSNYDYFYESAEGDTDEVRAANTELMMFRSGYTREYIDDYFRSTYQMEAVEEAVREEIAEVSEEQLQAAYDEQVAADEETYTSSPTRLESTMTGENALVCWYPEGYRTVKHVLVVPEDDVLQAVTDARNALDDAQTVLETLRSELDEINDDEPAEGEEVRTAEEIKSDIDVQEAELADLAAAVTAAEKTCLASVKEKTDVIYEKLAAGEDFDAVMAEYGEDPGMQSEPTMTSGYYVCADSTRWDENFTAGAMALEKVGDYSEEPVISASGVHIIYYNSNVKPGAVSLEAVRDALYDQTLENLKSEHYESELEAWVAALNPVYHLDAWEF